MCANPQWQYLLLTKFPRRYLEFRCRRPRGAVRRSMKRSGSDCGGRISQHRWRGSQVFVARTLQTAAALHRSVMFDWIIIGAQTATRQAGGIVPASAPPFEDVAYLVSQAREAGCRVWLKPNLLGEVNAQAPGMILPQENPVPREVKP